MDKIKEAVNFLRDYHPSLDDAKGKEARAIKALVLLAEAVIKAEGVPENPYHCKTSVGYECFEEALDACRPYIAKLESEKAELLTGLKWALSNMNDLNEYQHHPDRGDPDAECAICMGEWFSEEDLGMIEKAKHLIEKMEGK